jgi:hypothetical protein
MRDILEVHVSKQRVILFCCDVSKPMVLRFESYQCSMHSTADVTFKIQNLCINEMCMSLHTSVSLCYYHNKQPK